ncbi:MAG: exodeoxyribonuclease V subunit gamma [Rhodococcus sp. (in: high G+C Gram-positive bacteria)]
MVLRLYRATRGDSLATALAEVMSSPLADPFAAEVISVPAKGVERWLTQRLSMSLGGASADGIGANIEFPSPTRLVENARSAALGRDPHLEPWSRGRVLWTTLDVIDGSLAEQWCAVLAKHLGNGTDEHRAGRRWSTAAHLSELFRTYAADRPSMIVDWSAGIDSDGVGGTLAEDLRWQAELWRAVRARIGHASPAELLDDACAAIRADRSILDLPERVSIFGPTRLTTDQLQVIAAIAEHRDVHVWLPHPSDRMWTQRVDQQRVSRRSEDR